MYAAAGNCHVYVHEDADLEMAERIAYNAKVQRPGVCNAAETLLVHRDVAAELLPGLLARLSEAGVELVGDERTRDVAGVGAGGEATGQDWDTEYHGLKMAVGVVDSLGEAVEHINRHGTGHSDAIVTGSEAVGDEFTSGSIRPRSTSMRRPGSRTDTSSGWGPRSGTRRRSCTPAARSACAS